MIFPLVSLALPSQKQATPPKPRPVPQQKAVIPVARPIAPRPTEPFKQSDQPSVSAIKSDPATLSLLSSSADTHASLASLQTTLDWRYLSKANLSARPTSTPGQKALEAALRSAQGTLVLTKEGQARLEVTTPGKDALLRVKTLTDTKKLYVYRYDNDGKLAAVTERTFVLA